MTLQRRHNRVARRPDFGIIRAEESSIPQTPFAYLGYTADVRETQAPPIVSILVLCISSITAIAIVAGLFSGDWEASLCVIFMMIFALGWVWIEALKLDPSRNVQEGGPRGYYKSKPENVTA